MPKDSKSALFVQCTQYLQSNHKYQQNRQFFNYYFKNILNMQFNPHDYVSPHVTIEEVLQIKKAFDFFDRDCGEAIDPRQFRIAINSLGISSTAQNFYRMTFSGFDTDKIQLIDFSEFFSMMTTSSFNKENREEIHKIFIMFDTQRTGYITLKDLRRASKELGQLTDDTILQEMIEMADSDGKGAVSEEQFYNLITKKVH